MSQPATHETVDLSIQIGNLKLPNPILVASGTFGYAREMAGLVDLSRLGGMIPKTVTRAPRPGNAPWRTIETSAGMLNSIGLDNDGIEAFIEHHVPYLKGIGCPIIVSIAGANIEDFVWMAARLNDVEGTDAIELNISCPNVSGGVDYGTDPSLCRELIGEVRKACTLPILAKLTPNVTNIAALAVAAEEGGADGISAVNTLLGMVVDWKRQRPMLGNGMGGLSGPAMKPVAIRCVYQIAQAVSIPIVGIGGIATIDDVMEFLVAGATAVQIGTANFYNPTITMQLLDDLPTTLAELNAATVSEIVGSLQR